MHSGTEHTKGKKIPLTTLRGLWDKPIKVYFYYDGSRRRERKEVDC